MFKYHYINLRVSRFSREVCFLEVSDFCDCLLDK